MFMKITSHILICSSALLILLSVGFSSCKKYLDEPSSKDAVIPNTLEDLQAVLDNNQAMNVNATALLEEAADNYFVTTSVWQSILSYGDATDIQICMNYIWDKDAISDISWNPYQTSIYYANVVLDILPSIGLNSVNQVQWKYIKGAALFYRSFSFQRMAQLYCPPYSTTANTDLGLPLRITSDVNVISARSTVAETYNQIIRDLKQAVILLPETVVYPTRPNKAAAYGALARTFLCMRDYSNAAIYADSCLHEKNILLDYNTLNPNASQPIPPLNPEIIYYSAPNNSSLIVDARAIIDSNLYQLYDSNDLRKTVFFKTIPGNAGYYWKGSYASDIASYMLFDGISTDEMYLIRAECFARNNDKDSAMFYLNRLLIKRWKNNGVGGQLSATNSHDALDIILAERRKELCFRCLRWEDLRRLNLEGKDIHLQRSIGGVTYKLPANDLRWVMLFPWTVINRSGMQQNPR